MIKQLPRDGFIVECDECHTPCTRKATEPGHADTLARGEGFHTARKKGVSKAVPLSWFCRTCHAALASKGQLAPSLITAHLNGAAHA